jgi:uncharacterized protein YdeI (YjbR/CyaY-like superfamily)
MASDELPLLTFPDASAFEAWLAAQPENAPGAWLRFAKKGAPEATISKSDAIDCALAHGWVDGQLGRVDEHFFKTRFTPRRPRSAWSQVNRERVEKLLIAGRIRPRGQAQIDRAKTDGRWAAAYVSVARMCPSDGEFVAFHRRPVGDKRQHGPRFARVRSRDPRADMIQRLQFADAFGDHRGQELIDRNALSLGHSAGVLHQGFRQAKRIVAHFSSLRSSATRSPGFKILNP